MTDSLAVIIGKVVAGTLRRLLDGRLQFDYLRDKVARPQCSRSA
jgi:hypothetical protein